MSSAGAAGEPDPRNSNLGYWLSDACAEFPERVALIDLSRPTPREVTYAELDERMDRVANLLSDSGVGIGDRFALSVGNRFEFVEIMFRRHALRRGSGAAQLQALRRIARARRRGRGLHGRFRRNRGHRTLGAGGRALVDREEVGGRRQRRGPRTGKHRLGGLRGCACGIVSRLRAAPPRRKPPRLPALHLGVDRQAQGRRSVSRGSAVVGAVPEEVLAGRSGRPGPRSRSAVSQERDGGCGEAAAAGRRIGRDSPRVRAGDLPAGAERIQVHAGRRGPGGLHDPPRPYEPHTQARLLGAAEGRARLGPGFSRS